MINEDKLRNDLKIEIIKLFDEIKLDEKYKNQDFDGVLFTYLSLIRKLIPDRKRKVYISKEIKKKINQGNVDSLIKKYLVNKIKYRIENGEDINGCLSKTYFKEPENSDKFLDDWGIYHLHMNASEEDFFDLNRKMSKDLLMAVINDDSAYFIDITEHDSSDWYNKDYFKIIINNNWQNELLSVLDFDIDYGISTKDARKSNFNLLGFKLNGKTYIPRNYGGYSFEGTSFKAMLYKINVIKQMNVQDFQYDHIEFYPFCTNALCKVYDKNGKTFIIVIHQ